MCDKLDRNVGGIKSFLSSVTISIESGCGDTGPYVRGIETVSLGCGLSGEPKYMCGEGNDQTGVCKIMIHINPEACSGAIEDVRYVHDICCSGAGLEVSYGHLRFTSCGLFTGIIVSDPCGPST